MTSLVTKLETFDSDQLLDWLASALAGHVSLPGRVSRDEAPSVTLRHLLSQFQGHPVLVLNLEDASRELLNRFATAPSWSDTGYEIELLMLADFLSLPDAAPRLARLVRNTAGFRTLPPVARRTVLLTLHDLPGTLDPAVWRQAATVDPATLGPIAFSALLRRGLVADSLAVLRCLPDDSQIAATLPTFLRLSSSKLPDSTKADLVTSLRSLALPGKPQIMSAVSRWLETQPASPAFSPMASPLRAALSGIFENFSLQPASAVIGAPAEAA